jgi:TPR repeat protein
LAHSTACPLHARQNAREGDANAMLRLAKMYLNGQGCETNASMAYEWLRKARCGTCCCSCC